MLRRVQRAPRLRVPKARAPGGVTGIVCGGNRGKRALPVARLIVGRIERNRAQNVPWAMVQVGATENACGTMTLASILNDLMPVRSS